MDEEILALSAQLATMQLAMKKKKKAKKAQKSKLLKVFEDAQETKQWQHLLDIDKNAEHHSCEELIKAVQEVFPRNYSYRIDTKTENAKFGVDGRRCSIKFTTVIKKKLLPMPFEAFVYLKKLPKELLEPLFGTQHFNGILCSLELSFNLKLLADNPKSLDSKGYVITKDIKVGQIFKEYAENGQEVARDFSALAKNYLGANLAGSVGELDDLSVLGHVEMESQVNGSVNELSSEFVNGGANHASLSA